ncbi:unnamed protein product [Allacma fusca]|uniref:Uncharacterized protein n=1 Tax=Allacma fusca TaxID=39272 RepID=A0A8J2JU28_9HEXA|nr:unnamed protein product [Allacma fusca]
MKARLKIKGRLNPSRTARIKLRSCGRLSFPEKSELLKTYNCKTKRIFGVFPVIPQVYCPEGSVTKG